MTIIPQITLEKQDAPTVWYGCYDEGWQNLIQPEAYLAAAISVAQHNRVFFGAGFTLPAFSGFATNQTESPRYGFVCTLPATGIGLVIAKKLISAHDAIGRVSGRIIPLFSTLAGAIFITKRLPARLVNHNLFAASWTGNLYLPNPKISLVGIAKFVMQQLRDKGQAKLSDPINGPSGNPQIGIVPRHYLDLNTVNTSKTLTYNFIFGLSKLLGSNSNSSLVPPSIIADETSQSYRINQSINQSLGNFLFPIGIKEMAQLCKAGGRYCMESPAFSGLTISFIEVGAMLNRAGKRLEPVPFSLKPFQLRFSMVAGQVIVSPAFWQRKGGIPQECTYANLFLELGQVCVFVLEIIGFHTRLLKGWM